MEDTDRYQRALQLNQPNLSLLYSAQLHCPHGAQDPAAVSQAMSCPDCFKGQIHTGQPKGKTTKLYGLDLREPSKTYPSVKGFFEQLRKERGDQLSVGAAGFCWGYKHIVTLSHGVENAATPLIDAALTAHPSFLSIPSDIEKIKVPVSFACPEDDNQVTPPKIESIRSIVEKLPAASRGEVRVYENTGHGFAVRADLKVPDVAKQADGAEDQAVAWFHAQFKKP
ncbi:hypothetical protein EsDP_00002846 [Epichloe bromicola]|uniref:Dienelactone hydrolase domain-containing protein n=1 Tax=Epichloe bromicola TaxID=79588 RepID=A0ABQ0CM04_9HYPO